MHRVHQQGNTRGDVARGTISDARVVWPVIAFGLAAIPALIIMPIVGDALPSRTPIVAVRPASVDSSRFILNALLVPALDGDATPLRWVDPRPILKCGPDTTVRVNGEPLISGALVPDTPFELEWRTDGCHPFGAHGAQFDGRVRLTVFREDWGFSAMVEPADLRVESTEDKTIVIQRGGASLPQCVEADHACEPTSSVD